MMSKTLIFDVYAGKSGVGFWIFQECRWTAGVERFGFRGWESSVKNILNLYTYFTFVNYLGCYVRLPMNPKRIIQNCHKQLFRTS